MSDILLLPGDGIGPEIVAQAQKVLHACQKRFDLDLAVSTGLIGGAAIDATGHPYPDETAQQARSAKAILLGAVGGPKWDNIDPALRPEKGLLAIRADLGLFANLRPAICAPELVHTSALKSDLIENLDILIVRELTGGIYFGQPRAIEDNCAFNTMVYTRDEIERIGRVAFEAAQARGQQLCSVDKANVLEVSRFWRAIITDLAADYPDVTLSHMYVDNAAMQLIRAPKQFDVMVTGNLFGDILSDAAAMLTGSIGMLPSASLNEQHQGLYEPVHGSAPDIAGQNIANPLATILSLAMCFESSLKAPQIARTIRLATKAVLADGARTADLSTNDTISCDEMGDLVVKALEHV